MSIGRGGAGDLNPLKEELPEPVKAFASELRVLFQGLPDTSLRTYASRHNLDGSTVSRYLSGERIPQWRFVVRLLEENATARDSGIQDGVLEHLRTLYDAAVKFIRSGKDVHLLRDAFAAAEAEREAARIHEKVLIEALRQREERIGELTGRLALEQAQHQQDRLAHKSELEARDKEIHSLRATAIQLRAEITLLNTTLVQARPHTSEAEQHTKDVEKALTKAEDAYERSPEAQNPPGTVAVLDPAPPTPPSPPARTAEQTQTLQAGLRAIGDLIDQANATEQMHHRTGVARSPLAALLERPAQDPAPDEDLDRLIELLLMAMSREEDATSKSYPMFSLVGRRPFTAARADFYASAFCLMLAELYRARGHHDVQRKLSVKAQEHFNRGYPSFMGKPSPTGSKWNYRAGTVSYVSSDDKTRHALRVASVKEAFNACQQRLKALPRG
ncbi:MULTISPECIES: hypothetical protein [unclassified Streptomyces]|uniref:hypothetical protein n=1 Tax=Streptomyces sp. NPDC017949 TaxID=3365020 RepID=UPI0037B0ECE1